jgi:hypothetical protein
MTTSPHRGVDLGERTLLESRLAEDLGLDLLLQRAVGASTRFT